MPQSEPVEIRDTSNGIIQKVDDALFPKNAVKFALNMFFHKNIGRAVLREGTALIDSQIENGKTCLGLHMFIKSDGNKWLVTVFNNSGDTVGQIYRLHSGSWASAGGDGQTVADTKVRFLTFLDTILALDGTDVITSADASVWVTTGGNLDVGNMPVGTIAIEWRTRVYIAGVSGEEDTLKYSSIESSGTISWTSGNGEIKIEPFEGQGTITGLGKVPGYILIFKERALKRWNGVSTFPDDLNILGTTSHESIVNTGKTAMYFSSSFKDAIGFYETNGQDVKKLSRPIQDIVDAIATSEYANVAGVSTGEWVMWRVGDITYDGITYSNVALFYHLDTRTWTVLSFPKDLKVLSPYIDSSGNLKVSAGNEDGEVIELFTGLTDTDTDNSAIDIEYALQFHPREVVGGRAFTKEIGEVIPYTLEGEGARLMARVDEKGDFKNVGEGYVEDDYETVLNANGLRFHVIEFMYRGVSKSGIQIIGLQIKFPEIDEATKE